MGEDMNSYKILHHDMICVVLTGVSKTRLERCIRQIIDTKTTRYKVSPEERKGTKTETEDKVIGWKKMQRKQQRGEPVSRWVTC